MLKQYRKMLSAIVTAAVLLLPMGEAFAAVAMNLRAGVYEGKTRLVVSADQKLNYSRRLAGSHLIFNLDASAGRLEEIKTKDALIDRVYLEPYSNKSRLVIRFKGSVPEHKVFLLSKPYRLVVDFVPQKNLSGKKTAPAVLVENKTAVNKPAVNKPVANKPVVNKPAVNKPAVYKPEVHKPAVNKPAVNRPVRNKPTTVVKPKQVRVNRTSELAPGLSYNLWQDYLGKDPVRVHTLTISPQYGYFFKPILGQGRLMHKGTLSNMVQRSKAVAAINASFFDSAVWVIGNLLVDKELVSGERIPRTALVIDDKNRVRIIDSLAYSGEVERRDGKTAAITGVNRMRLTDDLIYYNDFYDTRTFTNPFGVEVKLQKGRVVDIKTVGNMILNPGMEVLSGNGKAAEFLKGFRIGDRVKLKHSFLRGEADFAKHIIGAGPLLVQNGRRQVRSEQEEIAGDIAIGRAPRTAMGIKVDGSIVFVVVDGRASFSVGMTLDELADYFVRLGAISAMNFDGGGSSEMVVGRTIINSPSDGYERPMRVGLGVFR